MPCLPMPMATRSGCGTRRTHSYNDGKARTEDGWPPFLLLQAGSALVLDGDWLRNLSPRREHERFEWSELTGHRFEEQLGMPLHP